jgi:hypothetical protein
VTDGGGEGILFYCTSDRQEVGSVLVGRETFLLLMTRLGPAGTLLGARPRTSPRLPVVGVRGRHADVPVSGRSWLVGSK